MNGRQPLRPDELDGPGDGYDGRSAEADALGIGRELESAAAMDPVQPSGAFADAVMAAIEREPSPRAVVAIGGPIRARGLSGVIGSVRAAVGLVMLGAGRPLAARALALGYLVVVGALTLALGGGAAVGAAGALGLFDGRPDATPITVPTPSPSAEASPSPSGQPSFGPSSSASPSASPSESPGATSTPGPSGSPRSTPRPSGTTDPSETPDASETPDSSKTPKPSDTPDPSETPHS